MTLSFPSSPINGAVAGDYTYDATKGAWRKNAALPVSVTHSDVAPSNPREGDQWWKSNEGALFTYYNDGTSSQWVESTNTIVSEDYEPNQIPAGAMMAWASNIVPANWLLCDGSAVSRSTYASLFAAIGTQYGTGDGTTTFNLPNLKGRTIVGKDSTQTEFDVLGETGGAKTHTLTSAEMPSHTHNQIAHSHSFSGTTSTDGNHQHLNTPQYKISNATPQINGEGIAGGPNNYGPGAFNALPPYYSGAAGSHSHTFSGTTGTTTAANEATGGGGAHNNLQPYITLNYIIKFSAGETPGDSQLAVRVGAVEAANNATPVSQNYVINGGMDIWQRGTSFTNPAAWTSFSADRWINGYDGSGATRIIGQQAHVVGSEPYTGARYFLRWNQTVAGTGGTYNILSHRVEGVRTLAGKTATISFWAKSSASSSCAVDIEQAFGTGGSSPTFTNNNGFTVTTSWQRFSFTVSVPSISGKTIGSNDIDYLALRIFFPVNTVMSFDLCGVQIEEGSYATPFRRNQPNLQAELSACQRYYVREYLYGAGAVGGGGTVPIVAKQFKVPMRATPSYSWISGGTAMDGLADVSITGTYSQPFRSESVDGMELLFTSAALGAGRGVTVRGALVQFSAEI